MKGMNTVILKKMLVGLTVAVILFTKNSIAMDVDNGLKYVPSRVVMVGIDGMHLPTVEKMLKEDELPVLKNLQKNSAWTFNAKTVHPPLSGPAWTALFYGRKFNYFAHWINDVRTLFTSIPVPQFYYPKENLFQAIQSSGYKSGLVGNWPALCGGMVPIGHIDFYDMLPQSSSVEETYLDGGVRDRTLTMLKNSDPKLRFVFSYFGAIDHLAHFSPEGTGPDSKTYKDGLKQVDSDLGEIIKKINIDKDYLMVVSDHGNTDCGFGFNLGFLNRFFGFKGSGFFKPTHVLSLLSKDTLRIPLFVAGPGIKPGCLDGELNKERLSIIDFSPLILKLLECPFPKVMQDGAVKIDFIIPKKKED